VSDIDTATVDSLKALDPNRPIREADIDRVKLDVGEGAINDIPTKTHTASLTSRRLVSFDPFQDFFFECQTSLLECVSDDDRIPFG
jgi:hypothetical protein